MKVAIALFFTCISMVHTEIQVPANELFLGDCLIRLIQKTFEPHKTITVLSTMKDERFTTIPTIFRSRRWIFYVLNYRNPLPLPELYRTNYHIVQVGSKETFENYVSRIDRQRIWNRWVKFVIIVTGDFEDTAATLRDFVRMLWKAKAYSFIFMVPNATGRVDIYTWFPYTKSNCGDNFEEIVLLDTCTNGSFSAGVDLFPRKIPLDLNGCPVKTHVVFYPPFIHPPKTEEFDLTDLKLTEGLEVVMLNTIAKLNNFTVRYSVSLDDNDWGFIFNNGTTTGLLDVVRNERAEVGLGHVGVVIERHDFVEGSNIYRIGEITWVVPSMLSIRWTTIFSIFSTKVWILIATVIVSTAFFTWISPKILGMPSTHCYFYCLLTQFRIYLGSISNHKAKLNTVRLLLVLAFLFSVLMNTAFNSKLVSVLTVPDNKSQINTVDKIMEANLQVGLYPAYSRFFTNSDNWKDVKILKEYVHCLDRDGCIRRVAYNKTIATPVPRLYALYFSRVFYDDGKRRIYIFDHNIALAPIEVIAAKGFPLLQPINTGINRLLYSGILGQWQKDIRDKSKKVNEENEGAVELTMLHFRGPFLIFVIGQTVAFLVFVGELLYYRRQRMSAVAL